MPTDATTSEAAQSMLWDPSWLEDCDAAVRAAACKRLVQLDASQLAAHVQTITSRMDHYHRDMH
eukprot:4625653-Prymnesium_polylepis.1